MLPRGYIYKPRPYRKPHRFKVPILSWVVVISWNGWTIQRLGYIATMLDSNPTGDEQQPTHRNPYGHEWTPLTLVRGYGKYPKLLPSIYRIYIYSVLIMQALSTGVNVCKTFKIFVTNIQT